ncbi:hypothetical protein FHS29_002791 [Saccharothrix tamanrassetensis]|uniref:Uncharacterized protein n=1 Tax=Saccharothrix tamanrassetensis TaxID=1051531 RepID=A0A841CJM4_9PSEU|nr:hypothetical protein [Saccharothrix tamanrassetensis]MBB5956205.1 hypothetical protein [Saccharothrix tamanrassetensis]
MPAITDRDVVRALRPFVRATGPLLDTLREANLLGLRDRAVEDGANRALVDKLWDRLAKVKVPGTAGWAAMGVAQRDEWWLNRVGRLVSLIAALPGVGGALADRLPIQSALGTAGQGVLLSAMAGEHGFTTTEDRVRLLAFVLFQREVDGRAADASTEERAREDRATEELTSELEGRSTIRAIGRTVWKLAKVLWALEGELDKRPQGRFYHQALGMLPLVGVVGDYFGERSALRRVRKAAYQWFGREQSGRPELR